MAHSQPPIGQATAPPPVGPTLTAPNPPLLPPEANQEKTAPTHTTDYTTPLYNKSQCYPTVKNISQVTYWSMSMDAVVEDADLFLDIDTLLASFSGGPAVSDLLAPSPPAAAAVAVSPESVNSRPSPEAAELLEIERFLMEDAGVVAGAGEVEGIGVEEFLDILFDGGEGEEKGKESEAGGSTDGDLGKEEEEEEDEEMAEKVEVDGDDPISKKKRR